MSEQPVKYGTIWISANDWIEQQTRAFIREFSSSRPRPSGKRMGFTGDTRGERAKEKLRKLLS